MAALPTPIRRLRAATRAVGIGLLALAGLGGLVCVGLLLVAFTDDGLDGLGALLFFVLFAGPVASALLVLGLVLVRAASAFELRRGWPTLAVLAFVLAVVGPALLYKWQPWMALVPVALGAALLAVLFRASVRNWFGEPRDSP